MNRTITKGYVVSVGDAYVGTLDVGRIGDDDCTWSLHYGIEKASFILLESMAYRFVNTYYLNNSSVRVIPVEINQNYELTILPR